MLRNPLDFDTWQLPAEGLSTERLFHEVGSLFHERFLEDAQKVIGCFLVLVLAIVGNARAAAANPLDRAFWLSLGRLDLFVHCGTGVAHLVKGKCGDPIVRADSLGVALVTLYFGHSAYLARRSPAGM
ncbi:hypothetical protein [Pseudomonas grimontii]|uniref:hypothetical protein n=1 Tax=Pseudomonas grimontii TaxID=129847 RepID=UPI00387ADD06